MVLLSLRQPVGGPARHLSPVQRIAPELRSDALSGLGLSRARPAKTEPYQHQRSARFRLDMNGSLAEQAGRLRRLLKPLAHCYLLSGPIRPVVNYIASYVSQVEPSMGKPVPGAPGVLALNADKFRKDLQILADTRELRIYVLDPDFQRKIVARFRLADGNYATHCAAAPDAIYRASRERAMQIWRRVLPNVLSRFRIGAVIGAAAHYHTDWDIGTVSEAIGAPYVVLHRENSFVAAPAMLREVTERMRKAHPFTGRMIILHNDRARQSFIDSGYVPPERVVSIGCLRMHEWVRWCDRRPAIGNDALLFSFSYASGLIGRKNYATDGPLGFVDLFRQTHVAFAELAKANPGRRFVVKTKYGRSDRNAILQGLSGAGIDAAAIPNYRITVTDDPHDLIRQSAVVIAFQSTTMLEAALAARPVVVPLFAEAARADHKPYLRFRDAYHLFRTAESVNEMKALVQRNLETPRLAEEGLSEKRKLFETYVSKLSADTVSRYVAVLRD